MKFNFDKWAHFDFLAIDVDGFHGEVNTNCIAMPFFILARLESLNDARFPRTTISDQYNFK